jgi:hypothetical protein
MKEKNNQTALDWLVEQVNSDCLNSVFIRPDLIKKCKEMEERQSQEYAEFCVHCDRNNLPLLDFEGFINLKSEDEGEE